MGRVVGLIASCALLAAGAAPASVRDGSVSWRTLASAPEAALPAGRLLPSSSFTTAGWQVVVFSSAAEVARALPAFVAPLRAVLTRARASTNFGYRRLMLVAVPDAVRMLPRRGSGAVERRRDRGARPSARSPVRRAPGAWSASSPCSCRCPRVAFPVPRRLGVTVQAPPLCPAGYSYAGFVSAPAAGLTATLTMGRLPALVTPDDHALAYASIVARDAQQIPREWLQAGIGRGAIGAYADDGQAWIYVEAQTTSGYQLTEIAPATAGVPVRLAFTGSGSAWTVTIDGKQAFAADLGTPATGTSTAVEVYRGERRRCVSDARLRAGRCRPQGRSPRPAAVARPDDRRVDGAFGVASANRRSAARQRRLRDVGSDHAAG